MRHRRGLTAIGILAMAAVLAGCGDNGVRRQLGLLNQGPDPFTALPNEPIVMPETNELPAPDASAPSPVRPDPIRLAREVLDTEAPGTGPPSGTERRLLALLGAENPDPGIRALLGGEVEPSEDDGTLLGRTPLVHRVFGIEARRVRRTQAINPGDELERLRREGIIRSPDPETPEDNGS